MEQLVSVEGVPFFPPEEVVQRMKSIKRVPLRFVEARSRQKAEDTRYTLIILAEQELEQEYTAGGGKIRILGGNIEATSGMRDGAGIGGGSNGMVDLIQIGGSDTEKPTVIASAYNTQLGSAIGTGLNSSAGVKLSCGTIEILSGDVTAKGNIGYGVLHDYKGNMFSGGNVEISDEVNLKLTEGTITPRGNCTFGKKHFR